MAMLTGGSNCDHHHSTSQSIHAGHDSNSLAVRGPQCPQELPLVSETNTATVSANLRTQERETSKEVANTQRC